LDPNALPYGGSGIDLQIHIFLKNHEKINIKIKHPVFRHALVWAFRLVIQRCRVWEPPKTEVIQRVRLAGLQMWLW
jgi:hypothetical protein